MEELNQLVQDIAKNIRELRLGKQLTQKEVAKAMGIHLSQYTRLESGSAKISMALFAQVVLFFKVSADKIMFGKDNLSSNTAIAHRKKSLQEKIKELEKLNKKDKKIALELIDLLIIKDKLKELEDGSMSSGK